MVQLTLICGENVSMLDIGLDMALQDFIALCKLEIEELAAVPAEHIRIICNGRNTFPTTHNLHLPIEVHTVNWRYMSEGLKQSACSRVWAWGRTTPST